MADVGAKNGAQHTVVSLAALPAGLLFARAVNGVTSSHPPVLCTAPLVLTPGPSHPGNSAPPHLAQCQNWLTAHLPHAERRAAQSNADGARLASTNNAWAAIASERAGSEFGLHVVSHAIQDDAFNRTRFAVICLPQTLPSPPATGKDCISLIVSVTNRPGAMHDLLVPLKKHGVSMTRFESRPARSGQWEYYFYIDLVGHPSEPHVSAALDELRKLCAFYKVLGSYPVAD